MEKITTDITSKIVNFTLNSLNPILFTVVYLIIGYLLFNIVFSSIP